jgi:hypothetical protein
MAIAMAMGIYTFELCGAMRCGARDLGTPKSKSSNKVKEEAELGVHDGKKGEKRSRVLTHVGA